MNSIRLTISPPKGGGFELDCTGPTAWAELSDAQTVAMMRLRMLADQQQEVLFVGLKMLYGLQPRHQRWIFDEEFMIRKGIGEEDREILLEYGVLVLDMLNFLGDVDPDATFPSGFRLHDFHYGTPRIWLKRCLNRKRYVGPKSGLGDCSFEEFMMAERAYQEQDLPRLAAVLYRPMIDGQRQALERDSLEQRAREFAQLDPALLARIGFGFGCSMLLLQRVYRYVFPKSTDERTDQKAKKQSGTWLDVAINMAKLDVTKVAEVERQNLWLALKVLNEQLRQAEEMEKQLKSLKS